MLKSCWGGSLLKVLGNVHKWAASSIINTFHLSGRGQGPSPRDGFKVSPNCVPVWGTKNAPESQGYADAFTVPQVLMGKVDENCEITFLCFMLELHRQLQ